MLISKVEGYKGPCRPTWINKNQVCNRLDGGFTGFFKLVKKRFGLHFKTGEQFHGIVKDGKTVETTEIEDLYDDEI